MQTLGSFAETRKGLERLKDSFLLYLAAYAIFFVPVVGGIEAILGFVGLILLMLAFRSLGRSSLLSMQNYRGTGRWLIWGFVSAVIVALVGGIFVSFQFVLSIVSTLPRTPSPTPPNFNNIVSTPAFTTFVFGFALVTAIAYAIWLSAWVRMSLSLKKLSSDLSQEGLRDAGNFYLYQIVFLVAGGAVLLAVLFSFGLSSLTTGALSLSKFTFYGIYGYFLLGGIWALYATVAICGDAIILLGTYFGYNAVKAAIGRLEIPAPPPPPSNVGNISAVKYCPQCGTAVRDPNANFCSNCRFDLRRV